MSSDTNQNERLKVASAETVGEKAAPPIDQKFLGEITEAAIKDAQYFREKSEGLLDYNEADPEDCAACAIVEDNPCPFHLGFAAGSKWAFATVRRASQNQTAPSGVEGAHEGTTADKNTYDESTDFCEKLMSSSLAPTRTPQLRESREPEKLNNAHYDAITCTNDRSVALAESSLSSPPQKSDLSAPCSPVPLSTQLDTTTEKI